MVKINQHFATEATANVAQDSEMLVKLLRLALKAGDERRIAGALQRLPTLLPKLSDGDLRWLLGQSGRSDMREIASLAVQTIATRETISHNLAVAILQIAHVSDDRQLAEMTEHALLLRLPEGQRDLFRLYAARTRVGPQMALQIARENRKSRRAPSEAMELAEMLISAGDGVLALRYIRRCLQKWPNNPAFADLLVRGYMATGDPETALSLLDAMAERQPRPKLDPLRISILLATGALEPAVALFSSEDPSTLPPGSLHKLIRLHLFLGNREKAEQLSRMAMTNKGGARKDKEHFQTSHHGQILNELRILDVARADPKAPASSRDLAEVYFQEARRILDEASLQPRPARKHDCSGEIPRRIWQYWNTSEMPEEIGMAMDTWRAQPGWTHQKLNQRDAVDWLRKNFDEDHAKAFKLANHIAEAADFLRLCLLLAKGGVYADADDKRTGSLDDLVAGGRGLLLFREPFGAISNNIICAAPGHPIMAKAVEMALNSLLQRENDSTWSKTGPGLLTRATALHILDSPDAAAQDTHIIPIYLMRRFVYPHIKVPYKSTANYWNAKTEKTSEEMRCALKKLARLS